MRIRGTLGFNSEIYIQNFTLWIDTYIGHKPTSVSFKAVNLFAHSATLINSFLQISAYFALFRNGKIVIFDSRAI